MSVSWQVQPLPYVLYPFLLLCIFISFPVCPCKQRHSQICTAEVCSSHVTISTIGAMVLTQQSGANAKVASGSSTGLHSYNSQHCIVYFSFFAKPGAYWSKYIHICIVYFSFFEKPRANWSKYIHICKTDIHWTGHSIQNVHFFFSFFKVCTHNPDYLSQIIWMDPSFLEEQGWKELQDKNLCISHLHNRQYLTCNEDDEFYFNLYPALPPKRAQAEDTTISNVLKTLSQVSDFRC